MKLYVGNISFNTDRDSLTELFAAYGEVESANIVMDRETGRSRGFGFVVMPDDSQAMGAISALNGREIDGRALRINEAKPREDSRRPDRSGGGGRSGGGRGGPRGGHGGGRGGYRDEY